jgi:hypothetical protein
MTQTMDSSAGRWSYPGRKDEAAGSVGNVGATGFTGIPLKPLAKTNISQSQQASKTDRHGEWRTFLFELRRNGSLPAVQRDKAFSVWETVERREPLIALPTCGVSETGSVYFGWNPGLRSLDLEIDTAGILSWFFADHETHVTYTSDSQPAEAYLTFVELFRRR